MIKRFLKGRNQNFQQGRQGIDTTVTFLSMKAPPTTRASLPLNVHAALLITNETPLHFYRYLYFQVGYKWHWEMRLRMSDDDLRKAIWNEKVDIHVLYLDGAPAGFFEINRSNPLTTDLAYFGMMEHATGRGLGRWFLSAAIHACWANQPDKVTVNTCTLDHPAALPLYQKMGFAPETQAAGRVYPITSAELAQMCRKGTFWPDSE